MVKRIESLNVIKVLEYMGFIVDEVGINKWTASKSNCNITIKEFGDKLTK